MAVMPQRKIVQIETAKIKLSKQLLTCALLCSFAVVVILLFHSKPYMPSLLLGLALHYQILIGAAMAGLYWASSVIGFKFMAKHQSTQSIIESYSRLDLRGWNPVWIALAAGFGEELLFRGALQPILGIWLTSALFVLVHVRAYRFDKFNKRVLVQALGIFSVSLVLGCIAQYIGLVTAMIAHAAMDVVGLYTIRRVASVQSCAAA